MTRASRSVAFLIALQALAVAARSQNDIQPTFEFSFSNPGARSLGLGGAFAALADDATAAFANPAGLVQITRPEVSVEGRLSSYSTPYVAGGRIFGEPTGSGLDSTPGLRHGETATDLAGVSFLSFVVPGKRWSLAVSRHQLADFETTSAIQGLYSGPWPMAPVRREFDQRKIADLEIVGHGLAAGLQLSDAFSVGLGVTYFTTRFSSLSEVYLGSDQALFYQPIPTRAENLLYGTRLAIDNADWAVSGGFLWRVARHWRLGSFFRQGPAHECALEFIAGAVGPPGLAAGDSAVVLSRPLSFPDVWGLGLSYRALDERLTMSFEWDRVGYSSLLGFYNATGFENRLEDGDELHLGAEYLLVGTRPMIALRAGAWLEPAHLIYNRQGYVTRAVLPPGEDELHLAAGVGIAFWEVQLDIAVDLSDKVDVASISTVYSF